MERLTKGTIEVNIHNSSQTIKHETFESTADSLLEENLPLQRNAQKMSEDLKHQREQLRLLQVGKRLTLSIYQDNLATLNAKASNFLEQMKEEQKRSLSEEMAAEKIQMELLDKEKRFSTVLSELAALVDQSTLPHQEEVHLRRTLLAEKLQQIDRFLIHL